MTPEQFEKLIRKKGQEIKTFVNTRFPSRAGNMALRFIDGNFRAQGWQGSSFKSWKKNRRGRRVLIRSGHLRSASYYVTGAGMVKVRNTMPYAKIHNEGGSIRTSASIPAFTRKAHTRNGRGKRVSVRSHNVQAHTRQMNITMPQRQFAPTESSGSPVLNNAINRDIQREIKKIFNLK